MGFLTAVTGKGGVGKTTVCALLVKGLIAAGKSPVLALDADPNSCLDQALGVAVTETVGRAREDLKTSSDAGISKRERLRIKIEQGIAEASGFDLIAMGRPEGAGCYCYANSILKEVINEISASYPQVVIDNEAGLENLSRRIVARADLMIFVSDASNAGLTTLLRLHELAGEMELSYGRLAVVINKMRGETLPERFIEIKDKIKADHVIGLSYDDEIALFSEENRNFLELSDQNKTYLKIKELVN